MKALTLHQPWASLVALGVKTIETRSWATKYRGPLAIHAGARVAYGAVGDYCAETWFTDVNHVTDCYCDSAEIDVPCQRGSTRTPCLTQQGTEAILLPLAAVVATCTLVDVVPIEESDDCDQWPPAQRSAHHAWSAEDEPGWSQTVVIAGGDAPLERRPGQYPYGDFTPGRFAWLLADITPLDPPVPAKGRQGLWTWTTDDEVAEPRHSGVSVLEGEGL